MGRLLRTVPLCAAVAAAFLATGVPALSSPAKITSLSLEELLNVEITSVSKKKEPFFGAASAVFVIDQEDIRRSGATRVQELLAMVPGLEVARIDNNKWAISARGFNARFANKLLILLDGRTIYSPSFSGVFWETQDMILEDIDRIEVIRGPGGTLWGANAVNGVINIITKRASDTQGGLLSLGGGSEEAGGLVRFGIKLKEKASLRLYAKESNHDGAASYPSGNELDTDSNLGRTGFRLDWDPTSGNSFTVQGEAMRGQYTERSKHVALSIPFSETVNDGSDLRGANLLFRWQQTQSPDSDTTFQVYFDHDRRIGDTIGLEVNTFDLDFQHHFRANSRHDLVWGLGYRSSKDSVNNFQPLQIFFSPDSRRTDLFSGFLQDEITLVADRLRFVVGAKLEHNDYSGAEFQPNARLAWTPTPTQTFWAAASRAVRTPNRAEDQFRVGLYVLPTPSPFTPTLYRTPKPCWLTRWGIAGNLGIISSSISPASSTTTTIF